MRLLSAILLLLAATPAVATDPPTCYNHLGEALAEALPCNDATDRPSLCCNPMDYCLSNGLCLNAGENNFYGQQGCTDADWSAPCVWHCASETGANAHLWLCANRDSQYCCGDTAACCDDSDSDVYAIGLFSSLHLAADATATTTGVPATTVTATTTLASGATATVATTATTTLAAITVTATPTTTTTSKTTTTAVIGVGVGLGVGMLAFSVAALAGGFRWGQRVAAHKAAYVAPPAHDASSSPDAPPNAPPGELPVPSQSDSNSTHALVVGKAAATSSSDNRAATSGYAFPPAAHSNLIDVPLETYPARELPGGPPPGYGQPHELAP